MSGYDCRNKCAFIFRRSLSEYVADVTSSGRLFQILGPRLWHMSGHQQFVVRRLGFGMINIQQAHKNFKYLA